MKQIELNVIESFRRVKSDIIQLQNQVIEISKNQEKIMKQLMQTKVKETKLAEKVKNIKSQKPKVITKTRTVTKVVGKAKHKEYVASKTGKKFHILACPFAKNIHPKSKIVYKSKVKALNEGYKACDCVKKI